MNLLNGKVLYENKNGTYNTVILSETVENFEYLEIFYAFHTSDISYFSSCKIPNANNKKISLLAARALKSDSFLIGVANINIVDNTITWLENNTYYANNNSIPATTNEVKIYKIIGYS